MSHDYLPRKDRSLAAWAFNFGRNVAADPDAFGLTAADAALVLDETRRLADLMQTMASPTRKTSVVVFQKSEARADLERLLRRLVRVAKASGMQASTYAKLALPVPGERRPSPSETPRPFAYITYRSDGVAVLRWETSGGDSNRSRRPPGTIGTLVLTTTAGNASGTPWRPDRHPFFALGQARAGDGWTFYALTRDRSVPMDRVPPADWGRTCVAVSWVHEDLSLGEAFAFVPDAHRCRLPSEAARHVPHVTSA